MSVVSIADHMQAVVDHLAVLKVGRGVQPPGTGWQGAPAVSEFVPYGIAWRIGSKDRIRWSLSGEFSEAYPYIFIRSFGGTVAQAEEHADAVAALMLARTPDGTWALTVPGRTVIDIRQDNASTSTRTYNTETPLPESGEFYSLRSDPA